MLQRVRPTKIELIRLRRFLVLARKVHKILRERLTILVNEFLIRIREAHSLRTKFNSEYVKLYSDTITLYGFYGNNLYGYLEKTTKASTRVVVGQENIMGIRTIAMTTLKGDFSYSVAYKDIDEYRQRVLDFLNLVISLGLADRAIIALGKEILKTRRKVNALEYILIPRLLTTIRYLRMKFEEREREEKARLKKVKALLEKRQK